MMGKSRSCTKLVLWAGTPLLFSPHPEPLQWQGELSDGQEAASNAVVEAILQNKEFLTWAVCGAGKTEVLFKGIAVALSKGNRVCIATPRTDVVLELAPRLKQAFPHTTTAALYGGSEEKSVCAQLVISTTHQLLRYYKAFDTIIIDEVDAFPYSVDRALQFAVEKSRREQSSLIYLTATPSNVMKKAMKANDLPFVTIPARFHRHSIPVPHLKWCGNWQKSFSKGNIPSSLLSWYLQKLQSKTPFLIFFPNIDLMNQNLTLFQKHYEKIEAVYAEDVNRKEKVSKLREGASLGLLTTTILERGITIPKLDVAVIGAEEAIFTESALVQIAGRVGRSAMYPSGDVVFFHYGKAREMLKAVKQIQSMNKEARERGLIDD
ncbi:DEAD/DEAH box helicase [Bacillus massiliigorillae]|uniref:DEAD/DEAH box helicase n=1 Tax=Bacillus massiliigorillae TaxID=1243664 RepID=UPI001E61B3B1|nr:DEAD/DEAH box helicase [Bacillus massiliigorillae]